MSGRAMGGRWSVVGGRNAGAECLRVPSRTLGLALMLAAALSGCGDKQAKIDVPTAKVTSGTFVVRIKDRCELAAEKSRKIICPRFTRFWSGMKIIKLVPEGTDVKKGDFLLSLDKTELEKNERDYAADVRRAEAELVHAEEALKIERENLENEVTRRAAELRIKELAYGYVKELPGSVSVAEAGADREKAEFDAKFAKEEYEPVSSLAKQGYQSEAELAEKRFAYDLAEIERTAKQHAYELVMAGSEKLALEEARLDVEEARILHKQAVQERDLKTKQAEKRVEEAEWNLKRERTEHQRHQESMKLADFYAPKPGVVVYLKVYQGSGLEKIKEGVSVRPYRKLMSIEDTSSMIAETTVEEAQISIAKLKQKAKIRLDAISNEVFPGEVIELGTIAREKGEKKSSRWWAAKKEPTGIRVFDVKIRITKIDERLRSGMAGEAEIIVDEVPNALSVPLEAVFKSEGRPFVYLVMDGKIEKREIMTGRSAEGNVVVTEGLAEGDEVCLSEPSI